MDSFVPIGRNRDKESVRSTVTQIDALNDLIINGFISCVVIQYYYITKNNLPAKTLTGQKIRSLSFEHINSESLRLIQRYCSARWEPNQDHSIYLTRKAFGPAG